ncbi:TonB C-terminal domain-containing protein [Variovorax sp. EL159]|uniref:TonB C-terminal domain-containing protein n=1 Tax=Variovorax sp. EL159 TaxID=1566270 RepID=UPI00115F919B|nr:TonB C-terminal domain-containing protein [Variovorax sp. EL159]
MNASPTMRPRWGRLRLALGWLGLGLASATVPVMAPAQAQTQQPVPQHWISYANLAGNQLQSSLSDPANETVVRLHAWMQERMLKEGQSAPPTPVVVRVWVAANGKVERVAFDSLGNAQADADLRALLTAQPLAEAPPRDMRQPMVLQLTLSFVTNT